GGGPDHRRRRRLDRGHRQRQPDQRHPGRDQRHDRRGAGQPVTADGAHHPDGLPVEAAVDGDPVSIVPVPRGRTGHPDWVALAAALPAPPLTGSRLPMPDGWVRIPLAGFDQVLYWAEGAHYEGIMPQVTLRRLPAGDPAVALLGHDDGAGL